MLQFSVFSSSLFFFKQKTAYEMRISDWSSDVCSSDLPVEEQQALRFVAIAVDLHEGVAPAGHPHDLAQCGDHAIARQVVQRVDRNHDVADAARARRRPDIGRASRRERVSKNVENWGVAGIFKKNTNKQGEHNTTVRLAKKKVQ